MIPRIPILNVTLAFLFLFRILHGEVSLRVMLKPPMVTLECLITNPVQKAFAIMMCPNDVMCFKSCSRLCNNDCLLNNITCTETIFTKGIKYKYTFDTTNPFNQGEWTCHFGPQQSSTVIFYNETKEKNPIFTNVLRPESKSTKLPLLYTLTSKYLYSRNKMKEQPLIDPFYVILLLTAFAISLFLNIFLLIRCILYKFSTKRSKHFKEESCFIKMCIRLFCAERYFKIKTHFKSKFPPDDNLLISRQTSNNIYECAGLSNMQPAILNDNFAYIGTPGNQRLLSHPMFSRSHSFPAKSMQQKMNGKIGQSNVLTSPNVGSHFTQLISPQESVSQIIYDDVAEPSNSYIPSTYFTSLKRPQKLINRNETFNNRLSQILGQTLPGISKTTEDCNDENILKDEINSRVEMSKEMIIQADTLLKRAGTLLNDKEQKKESEI